MKQLYLETALKCSRTITNEYSTSFSLGIKTLHTRFHAPIYAIYGFVRYADEIVDTFLEQDKGELLEQFREDTFAAIERKFSTNPVLHSFQWAVDEYDIDHKLIDAFLRSMKMDLSTIEYTNQTYRDYIWGSAEVVGLMCLYVFTEGDLQLFNRLREPAIRLGSAFQKVNFLRDLRSDYEDRGRVYFPDVDFNGFNEEAKREIEKDITSDFQKAYEGIVQLPRGARFGVYLAYNYYQRLFQKIQRASPKKVKASRIRIPNLRKFQIMAAMYLKTKLNLI